MADSEAEELSRQEFQVAYDGPADTHSMDVQDLAPALIAFGKLIREANAQLNGKKSTARVLVTSDFEHKCFNINFEVVISYLHQIASFIKSEEVKTAKQVLIDLGIIAGSGGLGLLGYLKWKKGKKPEEIRDSDKQGVVIVQIGDGNTAFVNRDALLLAENPKIRSAIEGALAPVGTGDIKKISFRENDKEIAAINEAQAKDIISSFEIESPKPTEEEEPDILTAWLRVYSPVYDEKSAKWRFLYQDKPVYADISETTIASDALNRGGAFVNDLYKVRMEVHHHQTEGGETRQDYKIIKVLDFKQADIQRDLPFKKD